MILSVLVQGKIANGIFLHRNSLGMSLGFRLPLGSFDLNAIEVGLIPRVGTGSTGSTGSTGGLM